MLVGYIDGIDEELEHIISDRFLERDDEHLDLVGCGHTSPLNEQDLGLFVELLVYLLVADLGGLLYLLLLLLLRDGLGLLGVLLLLLLMELFDLGYELLIHGVLELCLRSIELLNEGHALIETEESFMHLQLA